MVSDFEGDVASPLSRFRKKTRWLIMTTTASLLMQIGGGFSYVMENYSGGDATLAASITVTALGVSLVTSILANKAEQGTPQKSAAAQILKVLVTIGVTNTLFCLIVSLYVQP